MFGVAHGVDDEQMFKRIAVWVVKSADITADAVGAPPAPCP